MNERDKIIEIIKDKAKEPIIINGVYLDTFYIEKSAIDIIADALIKNGIGDVAEWKRRAEVAERNDKIKERALDKASYTIAMTYTNSNWERNSKQFKDKYLQQAEREIEEEERK